MNGEYQKLTVRDVLSTLPIMVSAEIKRVKIFDNGIGK